MLAFALILSALADPVVPVELGVIPDPVVQAARSAAGLPLAERMKAVSEPLLGLPYEIDGHGEGTGPDVDPPARYDAFDCVTFLEEVLAQQRLRIPSVHPSFGMRFGTAMGFRTIRADTTSCLPSGFQPISRPGSSRTLPIHSERLTESKKKSLGQSGTTGREPMDLQCHRPIFQLECMA